MLSGIYTDWDRKNLPITWNNFIFLKRSGWKHFPRGWKWNWNLPRRWAITRNFWSLMKLQTDSIRFSGRKSSKYYENLQSRKTIPSLFLPISQAIWIKLPTISHTYMKGRLLFLKSIDELNDCGIIRCGREFSTPFLRRTLSHTEKETPSYCVFIKNRQSLRKAFCDISIENASIEDMMLFYSKRRKIIWKELY